MIDIILRLTAQDSASRTLNEVRRSATALEASVTKIGQNKSLSALEGQAKRYQASIESARRQTENLEKTLTQARNWGAGLAAAGASALLLSNKFAQAARDVEESENLVRQSFGANTEAINAWSEGLQKKLGITATEARRNAATFNLMFSSMGIASDKSLEMSKSLSMLAYDMSSIYNISFDEAFNKLSAGITGETEGLKRLGILIDEETIKQYAYANGIAVAGAQLTQQQKVMARYGAILAQTTAAQGDLERTINSSQNAHRRMEAAAERAYVKIGQGSAEAQKRIDMLTASVLATIGASDEAAKTTGWLLTTGAYAATAGGSMIALVAQVGMITMAFPALGAAGTSAFTAIGGAAAAAGTAIYAALAPILPLALAIAAVMGAITAGAVYLQKRAQSKAEGEGEATDREYYEQFGKKEHPGLSFEEWREKTGRTPGQMNAEDAGDPQAVQASIEKAQAQAAQFQAQAAATSSVGTTPAAAILSPQVATAAAPAKIIAPKAVLGSLSASGGISGAATVAQTAGRAASRQSAGRVGLMQLLGGASTTAPTGAPATGGGGNVLEVMAQTQQMVNAAGQTVLKIIVPDVVISDGGFRQAARGYAR